MVLFLTGLMICVSPSLADYSDGFITAGEYEDWVEWTSSNPPLIVDGGGANWIEMRGYGRLEIRSTSIPINNNFDTGGIWDIALLTNSHLDYLGGITEEITIGTNATAVLRGGRIDAITNMQYAGIKHIDLYCRAWDYNTTTKILTGTWNTDNNYDSQWDPFSIQLINVQGYAPTIDNINFIVIPEPASLALLALGSLLIRTKK
jgi:hypothetical protein